VSVAVGEGPGVKVGSEKRVAVAVRVGEGVGVKVDRGVVWRARAGPGRAAPIPHSAARTISAANSQRRAGRGVIGCIMGLPQGDREGRPYYAANFVRTQLGCFVNRLAFVQLQHALHQPRHAKRVVLCFVGGKKWLTN